MPGTADAVNEAVRLNEIGFPEFTTKLITDVFDSLVSANIRQTQSYLELLKATGETLSDYINNTKDDIGGEEILQFLALVLPPADTASADASAVSEGGNLSASQASTLNDALEVTDANISSDNKVAQAGNVTKARFDSILDAVATRISANKYELLKEMVKLGVLRLVVEKGEIETRLLFTTYGSSFTQSRSSDYRRSSFNFRQKAKTGSLVSLWAKAAVSTSFNSVNVSTSSRVDTDSSGSRVQIFGGVKIQFKTDYQPLAD